MADDTENADIKNQQRRMPLVGLIVAAIPIGCRLPMLGVAPQGIFPAADRTFTDIPFWPIQIVLLCVAVAGNAIVDWVRVFWNTGRTDRTALVFLLMLVLAFFVESMMFSVTLLASHIGWSWLAPMTILGAANMWLAYMLEMELVGKG